MTLLGISGLYWSSIKGVIFYIPAYIGSILGLIRLGVPVVPLFLLLFGGLPSKAEYLGKRVPLTF